MFNKRLLKTFKAEMKNVYGLVLIQWLVLVCHILLTFLHSYVLSCLYLKQSFSLVFYLLSVICLFALKCFLQTTQNKQALSLSEMIKTKLRKSVFDKIYHQKQTTVFKESTLTQLTSEGIDQLEIYFSKYIPQFFYAMLAPLTLFIVVGFMSLKVALILLLCVPLIPVSIVVVQKIAKRLLAKYWNSYTGLADSFLENLQGLTTLKYYQSDLYYQDKMDREAEDFRKKTMRVLIMQLNSISVMDLVAYGGFGLGVVLGLQEYLNQHITFMMFVFIVMISIEFFLPLRMLGSYFHIGQNGNAAADKIFKLLDSLDDIQESYQESISTLSFEHVIFGYNEKNILKDVSFSLSKGTFLTIVGESGSGKSTIASLLMNLYPIQKGKILYNQETIPETMTLYQKITLIKDETYILKGTVFNHLAMSGCIDEEKIDMENQKPMDRLLCGDVGYGKTEVAIRAAFKCVMDQKQVVYLVPTTVLADQQYENFKERMKEYPIRVEVLNRFKTKKQQDDIIKKLKLGEIDVIVGTHRVLSKDVEFKDLGLLIIDEEHRFGVKDKEKIKQLKNTVDVLTMTATPIPRTLHMSIVGVRDMSVIYEPPQNRKPVQTYVMEYDPEIIKEAITKELERGGQVYYLYNNVEGIAKKAAEISSLVDEAKVSFAHGKMTGKEIEEIMADFVTQKTNVLVCTTILESGIDIPNANTIIVENAERLGLAQLYQIRGRVGRSNKQAYAYIMYKRDKILSEVANKRLKSIKEFTEFGSGFKIAMRDLEIRGAGSLLGEIQHGHMEQVGYDMYCKLLDEVVKEMQGYEVEEDIDVQIDINISSYIPDEYISDSSQKIEIYQDIALCNNESDIQDVIDELIDRYGIMPEELENLIEVARIKQLAKLANVIKISQRGENFVFYFNQKKFDVDVNKLVEMYKNRILFSQAKDPYVTLKIKDCNDKTIFEEIKKFLNVICGDKSN